MSAVRVCALRRSATRSSSSRAATTVTPTASSAPDRGADAASTPTSPGVTAAAAVTRSSRATTILIQSNGCSMRTAVRLPRSPSSPIAGNMGPVPPADGFPPGTARDLCDAHGAALLFDEVISGFRAAAGGAQQIHGVKPDLTCLGKIIGGGLPVGAYGGRAELMELVHQPVRSIRRNALRQSARDDGGLWCLAVETEALSRSAKLERGSRSVRRRCPCGQRRCRSTPSARSSRRSSRHNPCGTTSRQRAHTTDHYAQFFRECWLAASIRRHHSSEAWFLSAALPRRRMWTARSRPLTKR